MWVAVGREAWWVHGCWVVVHLPPVSGPRGMGAFRRTCAYVCVFVAAPSRSVGSPLSEISRPRAALSGPPLRPQLSPRGALVLALLKLPFGVAMMLGSGATDSVVRATVLCLRVVLLAVATTIACHMYLRFSYALWTSGGGAAAGGHGGGGGRLVTTAPSTAAAGIAGTSAGSDGGGRLARRDRLFSGGNEGKSGKRGGCRRRSEAEE